MNINSFLRKKNISDLQNENHSSQLNKILNLKDLTFFGIAAIIGAGIFSTIGRASYEGGPAVSMLFLFVAIACIFTALCYAQFASMIPVSGSAYTYTYVSLGEIFAWTIGWALILEYAVSNIVISISWSGYFVSMLQGFGIHWPEWLAVDYWNAHQAFLAQQAHETLTNNDIKLAEVYKSAPSFGGIKVLFNLPAGLITLFVTILAYIGIKESTKVSNALVWIKLVVIVGIILIGAFYVKPDNWTPFLPNGFEGVMGGVAAVFFSFIGFDSISTTAEECKNPRRDLPRAMILCIIICTVLYAAIALVLTGMVNYKELRVDDPLAYVFDKIGMNFIAGIISVSAVIAMTGAILVYQVGQPRIWMTMSRDGLLWKPFSKIHKKYHTPSFSTIIAGVFVAIPAMFIDMQVVVDLTSVGTFFAFILVCSGVLFLDYKGYSKQAKFKLPYINGKYIICPLFIFAMYVFLFQVNGLKMLSDKPLLYVFWLVWLGLGIGSLKYQFSLLPILGILFNLYLMTELGWSNWIMFIVWLVIGLTIYFLYGRKNSKLNRIFNS
ncbi:amino acid permease [Apibacter muscae]|uniref:amino acid permease n=1 Tax=Apibacter muscae TaxID=2509004 RepID=UPI0011ACB471|nr:amino acid permease [Apibacter muscae]TWP30114.1 amino acid permease [Apibacter muscae]